MLFWDNNNLIGRHSDPELLSQLICECFMPVALGKIISSFLTIDHSLDFDGVQHHYYSIRSKNKFDVLSEILESLPSHERVMIACNSDQTTELLQSHLRFPHNGAPFAVITNSMSEVEINDAQKNIASDSGHHLLMTAKPGVSLFKELIDDSNEYATYQTFRAIINFDMPLKERDYIWRVGREANRWRERKCDVINLISNSNEHSFISKISVFYHIHIAELNAFDIWKDEFFDQECEACNCTRPPQLKRLRNTDFSLENDLGRIQPANQRPYFSRFCQCLQSLRSFFNHN